MHSSLLVLNVLFCSVTASVSPCAATSRSKSLDSVNTLLGKYNLIHRKVGAGPGLVLSVLDELRERREEPGLRNEVRKYTGNDPGKFSRSH